MSTTLHEIHTDQRVAKGASVFLELRRRVTAGHAFFTKSFKILLTTILSCVSMFSPLPLSGAAMSLSTTSVSQETLSSQVTSLHNYKPLEPLFVNKNRPFLPAALKDDPRLVASYLLHLDRSGNRDHRQLDPVKLQKLLYYAQGYSLAVYGVPLFSSEMVHYTYGPLQWDVYHLFKGQSSISDDAVAALGYDAATYNETFREHVSCIFEMKKHIGQWSISDQTHQEAPYATTQQDEVIPKERMQDFFRTPKPLFEYCICRLTIAHSTEERAKLIRFMREYISYSQLDLAQLRTIESLLRAAQPKLEAACVNYEGLAQMGWPEAQSAFHMLMGHLFFPVQYDYCAEPAVLLETREPLQTRIALAASYGHVLAQYYCAEILNIYAPHPSSSTDAIVRYFGEEQNRIHLRCLEKPSEGARLPSYACGLYCLARNKVSAALAHFKKGFEARDPWCRYKYAVLTRDQERKRTIVAQLPLYKEPIDYALEELLHARGSSDACARVQHYSKAGELGLAEGYNSAAHIVRSAGDYEEGLGLFLLAARNHLVSAYEEIAAHLISQGRFEEIKEIYSYMAQEGDTTGLVRLAGLYKKNGLKDHVHSTLEAAGLRGLEQMASDAETEAERNNLNTRIHFYKQQRIIALLALSKQQGDRTL